MESGEYAHSRSCGPRTHHEHDGLWAKRRCSKVAAAWMCIWMWLDDRSGYVCDCPSPCPYACESNPMWRGRSRRTHFENISIGMNSQLMNDDHSCDLTAQRHTMSNCEYLASLGKAIGTVNGSDVRPKHSHFKTSSVSPRGRIGQTGECVSHSTYLVCCLHPAPLISSAALSTHITHMHTLSTVLEKNKRFIFKWITVRTGAPRTFCVSFHFWLLLFLLVQCHYRSGYRHTQRNIHSRARMKLKRVVRECYLAGESLGRYSIEYKMRKTASEWGGERERERDREPQPAR